jgi:hypothetical protein
MKSFFNRLSDGLDSLKSELDNTATLIKQQVGKLPVLISLERGEESERLYDEKHYFVIPNFTSDAGFSLHTMRYLPKGVPEVNALPKRRIFHFPNEHYEGTLRHYMIEAARNLSNASHQGNVSSLEKLANDIDALDTKLTYGMLLIGAIAAVFNPLIGAGIAIKAVLPGISAILARHGLKPLGEKATRAQLEKRAHEAEQHVLGQFSESTTLKVINPILHELEFALRTSEAQHDPLHDPNLATASLPELNSEHWRNLTETAVCHVYKDILADPALHAKARLGPEDIRWLQVLLAGKL